MLEANKYKKQQKSTSLFTYLERKLSRGSLLKDNIPSRYVSLLFFGFLLGLIYVANTHYYERQVRQIAQLEENVEALRVECTALKSSYMLDSKQSMVARRVAPLGLYEATTPPTKIKVTK